ncbi:MAG: hypothetical protein WDM79_04170 [Terricaulis sp.]
MKLVSIVAIDVVGFSAMSERDQRKDSREDRGAAGKDRPGGAGPMADACSIPPATASCWSSSSAGAALEAIQDVLDKRTKGEPKIRVGAHVGGRDRPPSTMICSGTA